MYAQHAKLKRTIYNRYRSRVCQELGIREVEFNRFRRIGGRLHTIYEWYCNGVDNQGREMTDDRYSLLVRPLYAESDQLAEKLQLHIFYQTDPRGGTIYLSKNKLTDLDYNHGSLIY